MMEVKQEDPNTIMEPKWQKRHIVTAHHMFRVRTVQRNGHQSHGKTAQQTVDAAYASQR